MAPCARVVCGDGLHPLKAWRRRATQSLLSAHRKLWLQSPNAEPNDGEAVEPLRYQRRWPLIDAGRTHLLNGSLRRKGVVKYSLVQTAELEKTPLGLSSAMLTIHVEPPPRHARPNCGPRPHNNVI
ncbi:hypothetical protein MSG28_007212 [Choristoneura fumiferana]|uniref:Uncharacterized protein n=1 Tax=Choristoneura fumiferana TaxID=7141 RepID=A0ACC0JN01_CHOFU|nr:hypothetical protein MSG28_007212 [Choristoneura fumiferana]